MQSPSFSTRSSRLQSEPSTFSSIQLWSFWNGWNSLSRASNTGCIRERQVHRYIEISSVGRSRRPNDVSASLGSVFHNTAIYSSVTGLPRLFEIIVLAQPMTEVGSCTNMGVLGIVAIHCCYFGLLFLSLIPFACQ